ncbi:MAG TPA: DUF3597 domain-containing protein [Methylovirgula sp.]|nr:DUF3597 domain-containing protein [Methylovirgula sp.]
MGIFSDIVSAIAHHAKTGAAAAAPAATHASAPQPAPGASAAPASHTAAPAQPSASINSVDVAAVLDKLVAEHHERLDWRHSIVDLLKALNLDSSLSARKHLAAELHYSGDTDDSAQMNIWLHKEVMTQLAANGGKVPDDLKH